MLPLLQAAAESSGSDSFEMAAVLSRLPAAQQLSSTTISRLLQSAVQRGNTPGTEALCRLVRSSTLCRWLVAERVNGVAVAGLLHSAVQCSSPGCLKALLRLPGAAAVEADDLAQLLSAASCLQCLQMLCSLPAARQLVQH